MRRIVFVLVALLAGCGGKPAAVVPAEGPLTIEDWKKIDDFTLKYDPATFERLKKGDPKLEDEKAWDALMRTVIFPQRQVDIPPRKYMN